MALTFPSDTTQPYVDPASGLKYIYNDAVGAWESAIQPPVIVTSTAPEIDLTGFLWYDQTNNVANIRINNGWTALNPVSGTDDDGEPIPLVVAISVDPPTVAVPGQLWWDSSLGRLFIYYQDVQGADNQWLEASPNIDGINGGIAFSGPNSPGNAVEGEMWFNPQTGLLSVYYEGEWVAIKSVIDGVETLTVEDPLFIEDTDDKEKNPVVNILSATSAAEGVVQYATSTEVSAGIIEDRVVSPGTLGLALGSTPSDLISEADTEKAGIVRLATVQEATDGQNDPAKSQSVAVTPAGLAAAITGSSAVIPVGMVTMFAYIEFDAETLTWTDPPGYLICDGRQVLQSEYSALYAVIGDRYNSTTADSGSFFIPNMMGTNIPGLELGAYAIRAVT